MSPYLEAADRAGIFIPHAFDEHTVDLGDIRMNYVIAGDPQKPGGTADPSPNRILVGYEAAITLLAEQFRCTR